MVITLLQLAGVFSMLSLLAVGGGSAVLPEMQALLDQYFQISQSEFVKAYGIGQLAPGPNMLVVLIMGQLVAGFPGALVVAVAFFVPSSLLCLLVGRLWQRIGERPWRSAVQSALEPISVGLMCSGVYTIANEALHGWRSGLIALVVGVLLLRTRINPVLLIFVAAASSFFLR